MAGWNGIFYQGVWSMGFDFLGDGAITLSNAPGVFDSVSGGSAGSVGASFAATSGKGFQLFAGQAVGRSLLVRQQSLYHGFHWSTTALPASTNSITTFFDSVASGVQACLGYNNQGQIGIYASGGQTSLNSYGNPASAIQLSATGVIVPQVQYFIEVFLSISNSTGSLSVRVNGTTVATFSGDTQQTANSWIDQVYPCNGTGSGVNVTFDNLYMLDGTGVPPLNTFLGPGRVQTDAGTGKSATTGFNAWAPTNPTGIDYSNCANIPPNTAQYNASSTPGQRMSLSFPQISGIQALFLNSWFSVEIDNSGTRTIAAIYRNGIFDQAGTLTFNLTTSYQYFYQPSTVDPQTGLPWSSEPIAIPAGCEIGLEVIT